MFQKLAKKLDGVLDYIAPREERSTFEESHPSSTTTAQQRHNTPQMSDDQVTSDAEFAKQLQIEEERKENLLKAQFEDESNAMDHGHFCKRQRVMYHHRSKDAFYEAVIVGVHYDDGPNKPYYTIRYKTTETLTDEQGKTFSQEMDVEKQTTPDRLSQLPWDEEKTWLIIGGK